MGDKAVLNCDYFRDVTNGEKYEQINKVKHECVIEIEAEIGKRDGRRDLLKNTNLSGQDNIDSSELKEQSKRHVFKCAKCEYITKTIDNLEKHRKVHERMKKCEEC